MSLTHKSFGELKTKYKICGVNELLLLERKDVTHLISIGGPGDDYPDLRPFTKLRSLLRLEFDDVEDKNPTLVPQIVDSDFIFAKPNDILRLINFARSLTAEEKHDAYIVFHCHAGISRSTAAAFIFFMSVFGQRSKEEAWKKVFELRPQADPNIWMIKLADKILLYHGGMVGFVAKQRNLSNYDPYRIPKEIPV